MPFDFPEDPDWGQEYFGGIFMVFNEAVLKGDILNQIKETSNLDPEAVCFLSFFSMKNGDFKDLDLENEIKDLSLESMKNYFYTRVKVSLLSEALSKARGKDRSDSHKYRFAFAIMSGSSYKETVAEMLDRDIKQIKRTLVI